MSQYRLKTGGVEKKVVGAYKKIENGAVESYKKVEQAAVGTYKKIEKKFVDTFLEEIPDETEEVITVDDAGKKVSVQ